MNNTDNSKAIFGKHASLSPKSKQSKKTVIIANKTGILIRATRTPTTRIMGRTIIDFENKRKRDSYKEINKKLEEG